MNAVAPRPASLLNDLVEAGWCAAQGPAGFPVLNPATGAVVAWAPDQGLDAARAAVDAGEQAFAAWRKTTAAQRRAYLQGLAARVRANRNALAELISLEQGKPAAEAQGEVDYGLGYIEWFADEAIRSYGETIPSPNPSRRLTTVREPVGVTAVVTPWNFPFAMLARKVAPALAAGCTVVAKPSEETPLTALAFAWLAQAPDAPAGLVTVVTAAREHAAEATDVWLSDNRVRKLSFTGSTAVGKILAAKAAGNIVRLSLELGGNAPFLVFDDADLDLAVRGAVAAKFRNAGQTCVSPNRFLVQRGVADAFAEKLARAVSALKVGPASDPASQIGPLINAKAVEKVEAHIADAVAAGARVLAGGRRDPAGDLFVTPTVLAGATEAMALSCEETFGPLAAIQAFDDEAEALAKANGTPFGLAAYLYTNDIRRLTRVGEALEAGMVGLNEAMISTEVAPFGGVKQSGYGREGSRHGLAEYQNLKYLCLGGLD
jgi:succinate-semialdehyde dehydrogenase/glutarate-semialdehyde dehydrogenase